MLEVCPALAGQTSKKNFIRMKNKKFTVIKYFSLSPSSFIFNLIAGLAPGNLRKLFFF